MLVTELESAWPCWVFSIYYLKEGHKVEWWLLVGD